MNPEQSEAFLARLWELQDEAGLSKRGLARELGVSRAYIQMLRSGKRGSHLSANFALLAAARFPELRVLLSLIVPTVDDSDTIGTPAPMVETDEENPPAR